MTDDPMPPRAENPPPGDDPAPSPRADDRPTADDPSPPRTANRPTDEPPGRPKWWPAQLAPRLGARQSAVALLCGLLGFGLVTQVHSNRVAHGLVAADQPALVTILADLSARADRLNAQIAALQTQQSQLLSSSHARAAAIREATRELDALGLLAGTVPAAGPGIVLTVRDPRLQVTADILVDALEELRDAGAEVMQFNDVRVVASTYILDDPGTGVIVDGRVQVPPYRIVAIGEPRTLADALLIAGGVADTVAGRPGARAVVVPSQHVQVTAVRRSP